MVQRATRRPRQIIGECLCDDCMADLIDGDLDEPVDD